jgi:hypothetical protein
MTLGFVYKRDDLTDTHGEHAMLADAREAAGVGTRGGSPTRRGAARHEWGGGRRRGGSIICWSRIR